MADYDYPYVDDSNPKSVAAYVASCSRVASWVKTHTPQRDPAEYFYSPSHPPSRVPSYLSDSTDADEGDDEHDRESIYSVPPKMVLKFDDGRPDVVIQPSQEKKDRYGIRARSMSASNTLPSKATVPPLNRPTFFYDDGPPTPQFPEQIRILPPLQPNARAQNAGINSMDAPGPTNLNNIKAKNALGYGRAQSVRPSSPGLGLSISEPLSARFGYAPQSQAQAQDVKHAAIRPSLSQRKGASFGSSADAVYAQYHHRQSTRYQVDGQQPRTQVSRPSAPRLPSHPAPPGVAFSHSAPARLQSSYAGRPDYPVQPHCNNGYNTMAETFPNAVHRGRSTRVQTGLRMEHGHREARSKSLPPVPPAGIAAGVGPSQTSGNAPQRPRSRASTQARASQELRPEVKPGMRTRHESLTSASVSGDTYYTGTSAGEYGQPRRTNSTRTTTSVSATSTKYSPPLSRPSTSGSGSWPVKKPFFQRIFPVGKLFDKADRGRENDSTSLRSRSRAGNVRLARRNTGMV
ncbi:hypothetical protein GLOTRDRAFT_90360 [Gloeophyllum trabeum ATCC 11539]|uniref:Uncharacterized protein n=1 Tax=Gloeophyllum trabeum (strain ATCC 11539 / FP-39264 / Madison 617) TaxID=670483 RepID=S7S109_GLOTA|nr:uncharacterized protein GLOTRDRAFT_90360 [Gloeophyllum trabeum ATCC 11539]EPQ61065.1 hypothetical protein GLOTRDRAFT_90360 [Gloeophyllum trabeum ATCC 11539]